MKLCKTALFFLAIILLTPAKHAFSQSLTLTKKQMYEDLDTLNWNLLMPRFVTPVPLLYFSNITIPARAAL